MLWFGEGPARGCDVVLCYVRVCLADTWALVTMIDFSDLC